MIPRRYEPLVFSLILSGLMSLVVSGVATWRAAGPSDAALGLWLGSWLMAWLIAFPVVTVVAPGARRVTRWIVGGG
jgi:hypothetical protein